MCEILVWLNRQEFEYDVYSLVRAFYPGSQVDVRCMEEFPEETQPLRGEQIFLKAWCGSGEIYVEYKRAGEAASGEAVPDLQEKSRFEEKNCLKQVLYQVLKRATGRVLEWGTLTGIRPVKLAEGLLEAGRSPQEARRDMQEKYYLSDTKSRLCVEIACREEDVLKSLDYRQGYSIYVGIPFCPSICMYCSFSSYPLDRWKNRVDEYVDILCREMKAVSGFMAGKELNTLYIGGGTPTTLSPVQMEKVLSCLEETFSLAHLREFTVEAGRPDSITREKLQVLKEHPVTRISVNPQTMNQDTLDFIGRRHTTEDTRQAFELAREMGFDNINMDLIAGLPKEGIREVENTLEQIRDLGPDSLTMHSLAVKRAARLRLFSEEHRELTFENSSKIMDMADSCARDMGMVPYYLYRQKNMAGNLENVGYAKPKQAGVYNVLMMEEKQSIIALGAGSTSKRVYPDGRVERCENVKDVALYIQKIDEMIDRKRRIGLG